MGRGKDKQPRKIRQDHPVPANNRDPVVPVGYNGELVSNIASLIQPPELTDPDCIERWEKFTAYLRMCAEKDMKVGNLAAYMAIGIDKTIAWKWENEQLSKDRRNLIKSIRQVCAVYREQLMQDGKVNPVVGIFWQKNYDGMRDQTETVITANAPLGEEVTGRDAERLAETYLSNAKGALPPAENMNKSDTK